MRFVENICESSAYDEYHTMPFTSKTQHAPQDTHDMSDLIAEIDLVCDTLQSYIPDEAHHVCTARAIVHDDEDDLSDADLTECSRYDLGRTR